MRKSKVVQLEPRRTSRKRITSASSFFNRFLKHQLKFSNKVDSLANEIELLKTKNDSTSRVTLQLKEMQLKIANQDLKKAIFMCKQYASKINEAVEKNNSLNDSNTIK
ncbi:MAG: hypothetical protein IPM32_00765 [Ignavibacteriae bacterium]|nr:hypothetical protein [Ignavibacteriota bacterium]